MDADHELPRISVVIITYRRPDFVRQNLERLAEQSLAPHQVILVDASPGPETRAVADAYPFVTYLANPAGAGNMTSSRNAALPHVDGDVIAFLDDDALPRADYVEHVSRFYADRTDVSASCSRTLNGAPGEEAMGVDRIGRLTRAGALIGNFAADPGRDVKIDHGIGATMTFRRSLLDQLRGFREFYNGVSGVREDADAFLRARALGHQAWFVHQAVADHVAAPQHRGQRFDRRYRHWAARNQAILMMANFGLFSTRMCRNVVATALESREADDSRLRATARAGILMSGYARGTIVGLSLFGVGPQAPVGAYYRKRPSGKPLSHR